MSPNANRPLVSLFSSQPHSSCSLVSIVHSQPALAQVSLELMGYFWLRLLGTPPPLCSSFLFKCPALQVLAISDSLNSHFLLFISVRPLCLDSSPLHHVWEIVLGQRAICCPKSENCCFMDFIQFYGSYGEEVYLVPVTPSCLETILFFSQLLSYWWLLAITRPLARDIGYNSGSLSGLLLIYWILI